MAFGRQVGKARAENLNSSANLKKIVGKNIATRSSSRINSFEEDVPSPFDAVLAAASHASFDDDDDDNVSQTVGNKENESKFFGNYLDKKPLGNGKKQRRSGDSSPAPTAVGTGEKNYSSTGSKVTKITTIDDEQKSKVINSYSFYKDNIYPYTNEMLEGIRESKPSATTNTSECMLMNDKVYKILGSEFNLNSTEALISKKSFLESEELKTSLISNECQNKEKSSGLSDNNIKKNSTKKSWNNETEDLADALLNGINALEGTLTLKSTIKSNKRSRETQKSNFPLSNNVSSAIGYEPSNQMTSTAIDRVPKLPIISTLLQSSQIIAKGPITTDVSSFSQDSLVRAYNQVNNSIPKIDKGLRHFSALVCAKVEEKGSTTYNEVADELVIELSKDSSLSEGGKLCDHKNIRRRVYDALNVLMAIDIIKKDKKDICWLGIPDEKAREKRQLEQEIINVRIRVEEKRKMLVCHIQRLAALKSLIRRNESTAHRTISSISSINHTDRLQLPFILINAPRQCRVHCEMLEDRSQYFFEFDSPFLINEDIELLRLMGLGYTDSNDSLSYGYESNNTNRHIEELSEWLPGEILAFYQETITGRNLECLQSASSVANHLNSRVIDSDLGFHEISIEDCPISLERDANSNKMAKNKCHNGVRGRRGDLSAIADETNEMEGIGSINTRYLSKPEQISIPDGRRRWRKKTDSAMKPSRKPRLKDSIAKHDKKSMSAEDMVNKKIVKKNHQDPLLSRVSFEQDLSFVMKGDMRPLKEVDCPDIFSFSDATIDRNLTRSSPYWLNDESFFFSDTSLPEQSSSAVHESEPAGPAWRRHFYSET